MENILSNIKGRTKTSKLAIIVKPGFLFSAIGRRGVVPIQSIRIKYNSKSKEIWCRKEYGLKSLAMPWNKQNAALL